MPEIFKEYGDAIKAVLSGLCVLVIVLAIMVNQNGSIAEYVKAYIDSLAGGM